MKKDTLIYNDGYYSLAAAVLKQWNQDGRPRGDMEGVRTWETFIRQHHKMMTSSTYKIHL
jgi:hypothetical protein